MLISAIAYCCLPKSMGAKLVDFIFATSCDEAFYYNSNEGYGPNGRLGPSPISKVQCLGYSGRGNPGGFYQLTANWTGLEPFEVFGAMSSGFWSVPLTNCHVSSIDFTTDYRRTNPERGPQLLLWQKKRVYMAEVPSSSSDVNKWMTSTKSLTSADFVEIRPQDGSVGDRTSTVHPDFSSAGESIYFMVGLDVFSTTPTTEGNERIEYDNINIQVHAMQNP
jgi:hypothetical protein